MNSYATGKHTYYQESDVFRDRSHDKWGMYVHNENNDHYIQINSIYYIRHNSEIEYDHTRISNLNDSNIYLKYQRHRNYDDVS